VVEDETGGAAGIKINVTFFFPITRRAALCWASPSLFFCASLSLLTQNRGSQKESAPSQIQRIYACTYVCIITYVQPYWIFFQSCGARKKIYVDNNRRLCTYVPTYIAGNSEVFTLSSREP
jgi:hypothetical protein